MAPPDLRMIGQEVRLGQTELNYPFIRTIKNSVRDGRVAIWPSTQSVCVWWITDEAKSYRIWPLRGTYNISQETASVVCGCFCFVLHTLFQQYVLKICTIYTR